MLTARMLTTRRIIHYRYDPSLETEVAQSRTLLKGERIFLEEVVPDDQVIVFSQRVGGGAAELPASCFELCQPVVTRPSDN